MDLPQLGRGLLIGGLGLAALGALLMLGGRVSWLGRLPGDVRIQRDGFSFYFPLTTCLLVSAVLSLIVWLVARLRR